MHLQESLRKKYVKFRSFSDFVFIGAHKNGVEIEEHYVPVDRMKEVNS